MPSTPRSSRRARRAALLALAALVLVVGACSADDDGENVGGGSASGSGSGSGLSEEELEGTSDDPLVNQAVEDYQAYVVEQTEALVDDVAAFTDAVRAGDVEEAKAAFAPSRQRWEAIEPIAGLIEDIDVAVDARVDDYESPDDPGWTGWHKLEYQLWEAEDISDSAALADQLDADIQSLADQAADIEITPLAVARGAQELIEEVSEGKSTGEEDRYSHTDLWDFAANVEGSQQAIELLAPALEEAAPELLAQVQEGFIEVTDGLEPYADGQGYVSYEELTDDDQASLQAALGGLSEDLAEVPGALGLG
ncbi:hypothetical protein BH24ACT4_BH24ACT4_00360 [soil metagenome]